MDSHVLSTEENFNSKWLSILQFGIVYEKQYFRFFNIWDDGKIFKQNRPCASILKEE